MHRKQGTKIDHQLVKKYFFNMVNHMACPAAFWEGQKVIIINT